MSNVHSSQETRNVPKQDLHFKQCSKHITAATNDNDDVNTEALEATRTIAPHEFETFFADVTQFEGVTGTRNEALHSITKSRSDSFQDLHSGLCSEPNWSSLRDWN